MSRSKPLSWGLLSNLEISPEIPEGIRWINSPNNGATPANSPAGTLHKSGYYQTRINGKAYLNHRIVYFLLHGENPEVVDHIDGNRTNNQPFNLRGCTKSNNSHNSKLSKNNTSGVKGLVYFKNAKTWGGSIKKNGVTYRIPTSKNKEEVISQLQELRESLHGDFCNHGKEGVNCE